jgi:micrococcal nuclease
MRLRSRCRGVNVLAAAVTAAVTVLVPTGRAQAATVPCTPAARSPSCSVWTGKVIWVADGDTPQIDIHGDGTSAPVSVRLIGVQAMEQSVYSKVPSKRRGQCHALTATARVEYLVKKSDGLVRLTAQNPSSHSDIRARPMRSMAVKINGEWYDIGKDLIRNGHALWMGPSDEWAWNAEYGAAAQAASRAGRNLYDTDTCGAGPAQDVKLSMTVAYDPAGDDSANINGEWFRIDNPGPAAAGIGKWWVRDSALRRYTFPAGTVVPAGGSVWVHAGKGTATATYKYWAQPGPVFANPTRDERAVGDGGYLFDPQGDLRAWHIYR